MANVSVWDTGTTLLGPNESHYWTLWAFAPNEFKWVSAAPLYKNTDVEVLDQHSHMDQNGTIFHDYGVHNRSGNWMECREVCLRVTP